MIDLNALTTYKNKISSYVDNDILDISTTSNILNMFKIKNYTGNGIRKTGSLVIDETGVASGFNGNNYIVTSNNLTSNRTANYEIQIKAYYDYTNYPNTDGWMVLVNCYISSPEYIHISINNNRYVYACGFNSSNDRQGVMQIDGLFDKYIKDKWFYVKYLYDYNSRTATLQVYDEVYHLVGETSVTTYFLQNAISSSVIFGRNMDSGNYGCYNCKIDLSESYIKANDELISTWNL